MYAQTFKYLKFVEEDNHKKKKRQKTHHQQETNSNIFLDLQHYLQSSRQNKI